MAYKFRRAEIEAMKGQIKSHCESDTTAWRLRLALEGLAMCCRCSRREEARRYREIALYELLTINDQPAWI